MALTYKYYQILIFKMFLKMLSANISKVNELVIEALNKKDKLRIVLFNYEGAVKVTIARNINNPNSLQLNILISETNHSFKLGNVKTPFSKRIVNDIEVLFHREYRMIHAAALSELDECFELMDVKHKARNIPVICRVFNKKISHRIELGDHFADELMGVNVDIQRNIFNKLSVEVVTNTRTPDGLMDDLFPVHVGVIRKYLADGKSDPVNQWFREVLREHVELYFK